MDFSLRSFFIVDILDIKTINLNVPNGPKFEEVIVQNVYFLQEALDLN